MSAVIACKHLKHNSCHMSRWPWPMPRLSVIVVREHPSTSDGLTGRLATHRGKTAVKI